MLAVVTNFLHCHSLSNVHGNSWAMYKMIPPVYCLGSVKGTAALLAMSDAAHQIA